MWPSCRAPLDTLRCFVTGLSCVTGQNDRVSRVFRVLGIEASVWSWIAQCLFAMLFEIEWKGTRSMSHVSSSVFTVQIIETWRGRRAIAQTARLQRFTVSNIAAREKTWIVVGILALRSHHSRSSSRASFWTHRALRIWTTWRSSQRRSGSSVGTLSGTWRRPPQSLVFVKSVQRCRKQLDSLTPLTSFRVCWLKRDIGYEILYYGSDMSPKKLSTKLWWKKNEFGHFWFLKMSKTSSYKKSFGNPRFGRPWKNDCYGSRVDFCFIVQQKYLTEKIQGRISGQTVLDILIRRSF